MTIYHTYKDKKVLPVTVYHILSCIYMYYYIDHCTYIPNNANNTAD